MTEKTKLRRKADKLAFLRYIKPQCEVCQDDGILQLHHFFPKGSYPQLRYYVFNLITLCQGCHFRHHHRGDPIIHQAIIQNNGQEWHKVIPLLISYLNSGYADQGKI